MREPRLNRVMYTLGELAKLVGGVVAGNPATGISGVAPFESAGPGDITLALAPKPDQLASSPAAAVIAPLGTCAKGTHLLLSEQPKVAFARILTHFSQEPFESIGVSPLAWVGAECQIEAEVSIHPFVSIGDSVVIEDQVTVFPGSSIGRNCRIGKGSIIHPNVTIYPNVSIGRETVIHSGTVIGADGFGYVFDGNKQVKIPQVGRVEIGDHVEIGANCCVDRATFGSTVIECYVKLDNLVHIGHNCRIGKNTVIVGCVGISGSVDIGANCIIAGQSGVADHVRIGDRTTVMAKTAVFKDVPPDSRVSGIPAQDHRKELKIQAALRRLPELLRERRARKS